MPDLQSELSKVINEWSEPEVNTQTETPARHAFPETTGSSRATSDYIRLNPGKTRLEIVTELVRQGYNRSTIYSLLVVMKRQGLITEIGDRLTANYTEYTPVKTHAAWRKIEAAKSKSERRAAKKAAKSAAYGAHENYNPFAAVDEPRVVAPPEFDAEAFANSLTLKQARAVYEELKKVFE